MWGSVEHVFRSPDWNGKGWYRMLSPAGINTIGDPYLGPIIALELNKDENVH